MNGTKTHPNKIGWCDATWNPITGCVGNAENQCIKYCYAKNIYDRFGWNFKPTFHPERLHEPSKVKEPLKIFVCSVSDIFATSTKLEWFQEIMNVVNDNPQHIFQFLTKCPENIPKKYVFPSNVWLGVTVTKNSEFHRIISLSNCYAKIKFVSLEPMLEKISLCCEPPIYNNLIDWIIIGAQTGTNAVPINKNWVESIIKIYGKHIPIYVKDNVKFYQNFKEFPKK